MRQFNAARIQRFTRRSAYGLRSYAADHAGRDAHVKNGADTQRTDQANRHIPLRILCLLRCRRYGVETHISKADRSEEHTSELQSLLRISYAVFRLKKKNKKTK